ncbi:uncharacterized protein LAJ45_07202 [Morchella importuna]|uniref:uncharacterized protein n=1 Tax=Morchella importuna TaxID=1174673 RepID=UPI001E8D0268|nr:uncharacterized protein LAJ45_07202 [Morchella importuna]KAH8148859.1 hypothetical protein LAJ45_07202 [Morchella importuna]
MSSLTPEPGGSSLIGVADGWQPSATPGEGREGGVVEEKKRERRERRRRRKREKRGSQGKKPREKRGLNPESLRILRFLQEAEMNPSIPPEILDDDNEEEGER